MENTITNNVTMAGEIIENVGTFLDKTTGLEMNEYVMAIPRQNSRQDKIRIATTGTLATNAYVKVLGFLQSRHVNKRLITYIQASCIGEYEKPINFVEIRGYLSRKGILWKTKDDCPCFDFTIANNDRNTSYIQARAFNLDATAIEQCNIGQRVSLVGKFASREYVKKVDDGAVIKTAYEVYVRGLNIEKE